MSAEHRPRAVQASALVAAVALVFLMGAGVLGYLLASSPRAPSSGHPSSGRPPAPVTAPPAAGAVGPTAADQRLSALTRKLEGAGYQVTPGVSRDDADCSANAYGQLRGYLGAHRCAGLHRAVVEVSGGRGGTALVALAWVGMPDQPAAVALKAELDRPGSGNLVALSRDDARYRSVVFNGIYYASARQDAIVVTAETQPLAAGLTGAQLKAIATAAVS